MHDCALGIAPRRPTCFRGVTASWATRQEAYVASAVRGQGAAAEDAEEAALAERVEADLVLQEARYDAVRGKRGRKTPNLHLLHRQSEENETLADSQRRLAEAAKTAEERAADGWTSAWGPPPDRPDAPVAPNPLRRNFSEPVTRGKCGLKSKRESEMSPAERTEEARLDAEWEAERRIRGGTPCDSCSGIIGAHGPGCDAPNDYGREDDASSGTDQGEGPELEATVDGFAYRSPATSKVRLEVYYDAKGQPIDRAIPLIGGFCDIFDVHTTSLAIDVYELLVAVRAATPSGALRLLQQFSHRLGRRHSEKQIRELLALIRLTPSNPSPSSRLERDQHDLELRFDPDGALQTEVRTAASHEHVPCSCHGLSCRWSCILAAKYRRAASLAAIQTYSPPLIDPAIRNDPPAVLREAEAIADIAASGEGCLWVYLGKPLDSRSFAGASTGRVMYGTPDQASNWSAEFNSSCTRCYHAEEVLDVGRSRDISLFVDLEIDAPRNVLRELHLRVREQRVERDLTDALALPALRRSAPEGLLRDLRHARRSTERGRSLALLDQHVRAHDVFSLTAHGVLLHEAAERSASSATTDAPAGTSACRACIPCLPGQPCLWCDDNVGVRGQDLNRYY